MECPFFQAPDTANAERWFNRIVANLLYYQTNYFVSALVIFMLVGFTYPQEMLLGVMIAVSNISKGGMVWMPSENNSIFQNYL